ncbi:MAG TPA: LysM domain-containing protein [Bacilli bacterium]
MNFCPEGTFLYTVRFGDTLWKLAERFNTTVEDIIDLNPGIDPDRLAVGQQLCLPLVEGDIDADIDPADSLNNTLRMLWSDHIFWTNNLTLALIYDLPIREAALEMAMRNADAFAEVFMDYYGSDFAQRFKTLFVDHLRLAADLINAGKANDQEKFTAIDRDWFQNADNIARLLSENNPFWNFDEWRDMLYMHLEMLKTYVSYLLTGSFGQIGDLTEDIRMQGLEMADYMSEGIIRQFPEDFDEE